jgi:hypothetical protein
MSHVKFILSQCRNTDCEVVSARVERAIGTTPMCRAMSCEEKITHRLSNPCCVYLAIMAIHEVIMLSK